MSAYYAMTWRIQPIDLLCVTSRSDLDLNWNHVTSLANANWPPWWRRKYYAQRNIFLTIFKLKGTRSWWRLFFWLWTKRSSVWLLIKRKTVTMIVFISIWKELEKDSSECKDWVTPSAFQIEAFFPFFFILIARLHHITGLDKSTYRNLYLTPLGVMGAQLKAPL